MTYDTINDGEATPLQISEGTTAAAPNSRKKRASPIIARAMMVGTAIGTRDLVGGGDIEEYGSTQQEEEGTRRALGDAGSSSSSYHQPASEYYSYSRINVEDQDGRAYPAGGYRGGYSLADGRSFEDGDEEQLPQRRRHWWSSRLEQ